MGAIDELPSTINRRVGTVRRLGRGRRLLLHDAFDGAGKLDVHTIAPVNTVGAVWAGQANEFTLSGGEVQPDAAGRHATFDALRTAYTLTWEGKIGGTGSTALAALARVNSEFTQRWYLWAQVNVLAIYENTTLRASQAVTLDQNTYYTFKGIVTPTALTFICVGVNQVSYSSAQYGTNTRAGLYAQSVNNRVRDFKVEA